MRYILFCLILLIVLQLTEAGKIITKDGSEYNGTIVGENVNFVTVSINGKSVQILKSIITEVNGKPYTQSQPQSQPQSQSQPQPQPQPQSQPQPQPQPQPQSQSQPTKITYIAAYMKNHTTIKGTLLSENDSAIVISTGNKEITLVRDSISGIEKSGTPPSPQSQVNQAGQHVTADAGSLPISASQITPSQSFPDTISKNSSVTTPAEVKRDSRIRITLKNGASFSGKILSENERVIRFESDGTVINIIRQLIKDIDGLVINRDILPKDSILVKSSRFPEKSQSTDTLPDLSRLFPSVQIPQGLSVAHMIDSLKSKKWEQRSIHARYLTVTGQWGAQAVEPLQQMLSDTVMSKIYEPIWIDSSNVNQLLPPGDEASRALARMGDAGFRALQLSAADTSALIRRRAAFGLGEISTVQAWNTLVTMLRDADRGVRAVAVTGLRSTRYSEQLIQMLKDDDAEVRTDAAFMLGKMKDRNAIRHLRSLLYDKRSIVRAQAADALVRIGTPEAILQLANATRDAAISVRENAAYALGESGDSSAVQPLIRLLKDKITSVRIASIDALAQIRDPQAIPSLYSMLNDDDPEVRERTGNALKNHTDIQSLIDALSNKSMNVRENVLYLLWLMSGQNFDLDKEAWQDWYNKTASPARVIK